MAINATNEFNALSLLSPSDQLWLMNLALSGDGPVCNVFTQEADRLGLTAKGRARKELEERQRTNSLMQTLREQTAQFFDRIALRDQAVADALLQLEQKERIAKEELRQMRDRAYEITMPDGKVKKVFRDGGTVRTEDGETVAADIIRPEDLPRGAPTWSELQNARGEVDAVAAERERILNYQKYLQDAHDRAATDALSSKELEELERKLDGAMPESVRRNYDASRPAIMQQIESAAVSQGGLIKPFERATTGTPVVAELNEDDFTALTSTPAARTSAPR